MDINKPKIIKKPVKNTKLNLEITQTSITIPLLLKEKSMILSKKYHQSLSGYICTLLERECKKHQFDEESLKVSSGVEELESLTPEIIKQKFEQSMKKNFFEED